MHLLSWCAPCLQRELMPIAWVVWPLLTPNSLGDIWSSQCSCWVFGKLPSTMGRLRGSSPRGRRERASLCSCDEMTLFMMTVGSFCHFPDCLCFLRWGPTLMDYCCWSQVSIFLTLSLGDCNSSHSTECLLGAIPRAKNQGLSPQNPSFGQFSNSLLTQ